MQQRICAYLRHPKEAFEVPRGPDYSHPHTAKHGDRRIDETSIDLCDWLGSTHAALPDRLNKIAGGGLALNDGDCDRCPCFMPVNIGTPWRPADKKER